MLKEFVVKNQLPVLILPALILINNNTEVVTFGDLYLISIIYVSAFIAVSILRFFNIFKKFDIVSFLNFFLIINIVSNYIIFKNNFIEIEYYLLIFLTSLIIYVLTKKKYEFIFDKFSKFIQLFILIFVVITCVSMFIKKDIENSIKFENNYFENLKLTVKPDIYHIIPDGYMSPNVLKNYDFYIDNKFEDSLNKNGLYLLDSRNNYATTFASIPSMLNGSIFDENTKVYETEFYKLPNNSSFTKMLLENNYDIMWFQNTWNGTKCINTDFICPQNRDISNIFDSEIVIEYFKLINVNLFWYEKILAFFEIKKKYHLDKIQNTISKVKMKNPTYVFAHILLPHQPFKVDEKCNPIYLSDFSPKWTKKHYFTQTACLEKQILNFYKFVKKQGRPFIFIISSDTGWTFNDEPENPTLYNNVKWSENQFKNVIIVNKEAICFDKENVITNAELLPYLIACSENKQIPIIKNSLFDAYYWKTGHPDGRKFIKRSFN